MEVTLAKALEKVGINSENVRSKLAEVRENADRWLQNKPAPEGLKRRVRQFLNLATDIDLPLRDLAILIGAVAYIITPFDFIFDFIPILGWTDDFTVATLALSTLKNQWKRHEIKEMHSSNHSHSEIDQEPQRSQKERE